MVGSSLVYQNLDFQSIFDGFPLKECCIGITFLFGNENLMFIRQKNPRIFNPCKLLEWERERFTSKLVTFQEDIRILVVQSAKLENLLHHAKAKFDISERKEKLSTISYCISTVHNKKVIYKLNREVLPPKLCGTINQLKVGISGQFFVC